MVNITKLPIELISHILQYKDICIKDILNFRSTCKIFCAIIDSDNILWRCKFFQRWPLLKEVCYKKWRHLYPDARIKLEVKERMTCRKKLLNFFSAIHEKYHHRDDLSACELKEFDSLLRVEESAHHMKHLYLEDELIEILDECQKDGFSQENINLTHMYYAKKFFSYMKQRYLKNQWRQFLALPAKQQVLEQAGVMMIQWCKLKARVSTACTKTALDKIALDVMKLLRECNPKHSILSISDEQLRFWKSNNIDDNHWNRVETVQLLDTINKVVHNEFKFHIHCGSSLLWPELSFDYIFNYATQIEDLTGLNIYAAVIFHAVARRLGVRCDLMPFFSYFFLIWRESYNTTNSKSKDFYTINVFCDGSILCNKDALVCSNGRQNYIRNISDLCAPLTPLQLIHHLAEHFPSYWKDPMIERSLLELLYMVNSQNTNTILRLSRLYFTRNMDCTVIIAILNSALNNPTIPKMQAADIRKMLSEISKRAPLQSLHTVPNRRVAKLKYAIGMLVNIKRGRLFDKGVIVGWDATFDENTYVSNFRDNMDQLNVCQLSRLNYQQPYYKILATNNETMYIPQDIIKPINLNEGTFIKHHEIGRYFSYYKKTHYIPSQILNIMYPEDAAVREQWLSKLKFIES